MKNCGYRVIKDCRACGTDRLITVVNLGSQHIVDFVSSPRSVQKPTVPLELVKCDHCNLVQLRHSVDPDMMYRTFWYRSGINESMRAALQDVVTKAIEVGVVREGDAVLDIGANDGTLLSMYPPQVHTVGVDPSNQIETEEARGRMEYAIHDYFHKGAVSEAIRKLGKKFSAITAIAMFYDIEDPAGFLHDCKHILRDDGVVIIQMNYLKTMLENNAVDNICHEHITYFSLTSLNWLVNRIGFSIVDVEVNPVNGGSLRVYLMKTPVRKDLYPQGGAQRVYDLLKDEQEFGMDSTASYEAFEKRVKDILYTVSKYVCDSTLKGKKCYGYGASTRGTTYLQCTKVPLAGVAERDTNKIGLRMVGDWLMIYDEDFVRERADVMLVLPWHFKPVIVEREKAWLEKGGTLLFALPLPHIVTKDGEQLLGIQSMNMKNSGSLKSKGATVNGISHASGA